MQFLGGVSSLPRSISHFSEFFGNDSGDIFFGEFGFGRLVGAAGRQEQKESEQYGDG